MNAVGIDVSKNKSMVAVARPFGQIEVKPFEVRTPPSNLRSRQTFSKAWAVRRGWSWSIPGAL